MFTNDYPTWSFGLTVSYPFGRSFEEASLARAEVERRQAAQRIASLRVEAAETVRGRAPGAQHGGARGSARARRDACRGAPVDRSSAASMSASRQRFS